MITFSRPIALPHYDQGEIETMKPANGYDHLRRGYDGRLNKIEIQPMVFSASEKAPFGKLIPSGLTYWIGENHLTRLVAGNNS